MELMTSSILLFILALHLILVTLTKSSSEIPLGATFQVDRLSHIIMVTVLGERYGVLQQ